MDPKTIRDKVAVGVRQPLFHSSGDALTTDTSPQSLGLQSSLDNLDKTAPDLSASGRVRRMVEMTVDKLGRSKSLGSKSQPVSPKRMFGLNRGEGKDTPCAYISPHMYIHVLMPVCSLCSNQESDTFPGSRYLP
jgi:hypothetical protein